MLTVEPASAPLDAPTSITNRNSRDAAVQIRCHPAHGGVQQSRIIVPPGTHNAEAVGLFSELQAIDPDPNTALEALLAPAQAGATR